MLVWPGRGRAVCCGLVLRGGWFFGNWRGGLRPPAFYRAYLGPATDEAHADPEFVARLGRYEPSAAESYPEACDSGLESAGGGRRRWGS